MVIVDDFEALQYAAQIILVANDDVINISKGLDSMEMDWNNVWVVANGVKMTEMDRIEALLRLKVDFVIPSCETVQAKDVFMNMAKLSLISGNLW